MSDLRYWSRVNLQHNSASGAFDVFRGNAGVIAVEAWEVGRAALVAKHPRRRGAAAWGPVRPQFRTSTLSVKTSRSQPGGVADQAKAKLPPVKAAAVLASTALLSNSNSTVRLSAGLVNALAQRVDHAVDLGLSCNKGWSELDGVTTVANIKTFI